MPKENKKNKDEKSLQLVRLFPNIVTILGLCAGLSSMRWALDERWELAASLILIAAFIDAVDGRLARMLNSTSNFGAQLDSLADFLNFGVAPVFILYLWKTHEIKGLGWAIALFFAICCALRLARFNTALEDESQKPSESFFIGMPSPAGALMVLGPITLTLAFANDYPDLFKYISFVHNPLFVCAYTAFIAILMASRIPTFSLKKTVIRKDMSSLVLALAGLLVIGFFTEPWITLSLVGVVYTLSIPFSVISYQLARN